MTCRPHDSLSGDEGPVALLCGDIVHDAPVTLPDIADAAAGDCAPLCAAMGWTAAEYTHAIHNALRARAGLPPWPAPPTPASLYRPPMMTVAGPIRRRAGRPPGPRKPTPLQAQKSPIAMRPLPAGPATVCRTCWLVHPATEGCK